MAGELGAIGQGSKCVQVKGRVAFASPPCPVHTAWQSRAGKKDATHRRGFSENQVAWQGDQQENQKKRGIF